MKLTFYMKSGNVIEQRGVKDWELRSDPAGGINYISITYFKDLFLPRKRLIITSLDLTQVEAIVRG